MHVIVVFCIISMLVGAIATLHTNARTTPTDAKRVEDIHGIAHALETYRSIAGSYPIAEHVTTLTGTDPVSRVLVQNRILSSMPADPAAPQYQYQYRSNTSGTTYELLFCIDTWGDTEYAPGCGNVYTP
jgi:type II secretory pathway pseudopilin PulG